MTVPGLTLRAQGRWFRRRAAGARPSVDVSAGRPAQTRARRIMVVDDDAALRTLYRFNLEASGVSVVEAADGEAALELLARDELPDVVLLDVMMPGIDGWTVAQRLRADPRTEELPIIFITARAEEPARSKGRALGAIGYLTKPFNPVSLADDVERILNGPVRDDDPPGG